MTDRIELHGIQVYAYHGVDPGERELGQRFELDLTLELDLARAGADDDLAATVNYREVYRRVVELMNPPCLLIEAVAERVATTLLAEQPLLAAIVVRVRKPSVPIGGVIGWAQVELRRTR